MADEYLSTDPNAGAAATAPAQQAYLSTDPNAGISSDPALAGIRANYSQELSDPNVAGKLYSLTHQEVGTQGPAAQQAFVETVFNRAAARGMSLAQTVSDPNYYPAVSLRPTALSQDHIDHYEGLAANAVQGSNISNYATGNASGTVGFDGGPQTFKAGGERFGIEKHDLGWAQNFDQMQQGAPAQQVDTYTRVEKAVPVTEVEHQVARAYPVSGPRPPLPKGPDTLNAPPQATPGGYLSTDPDAGLTPPTLAAPEGDFPLATALVPPQFTNFMPQQVAPTESGKLPEQPPPDILRKPGSVCAKRIDRAGLYVGGNGSREQALANAPGESAEGERRRYIRQRTKAKQLRRRHREHGPRFRFRAYVHGRFVRADPARGPGGNGGEHAAFN